MEDTWSTGFKDKQIDLNVWSLMMEYSVLYLCSMQLKKSGSQWLNTVLLTKLDVLHGKRNQDKTS